jgi:hypothetical protein
LGKLKIMKLTDLKSPYRELAEMRHEQKPYIAFEANFLADNGLQNAFYWQETKEGDDFWVNVQEEKYPTIPQSSLDELKAWQEAKEPKPTVITEDHRLFTAAVAAMQGILANNTIVESLNGMVGVAESAVLQAKALIEQLNKVK